MLPPQSTRGVPHRHAKQQNCDHDSASSFTSSSAAIVRRRRDQQQRRRLRRRLDPPTKHPTRNDGRLLQRCNDDDGDDCDDDDDDDGNSDDINNNENCGKEVRMAAAKMRLHSVTLRSGRPKANATGKRTRDKSTTAACARRRACNDALLPFPAHRASGRSRATPSSGSDGPAPRTGRTSSSYPPFREEETEPGIWSGAAGLAAVRARDRGEPHDRPGCRERRLVARALTGPSTTCGDRAILRHAGTLHSHALPRRPRNAPRASTGRRFGLYQHA
jgi:hypothetical protein